MLDVQNNMEEYYSPQLLADILSLPKRSIESKINKGEIPVCKETGFVRKSHVSDFPEIKSLTNSEWESELLTQPKRHFTLVELFAGGGGLALGLEQAGFKSILLNEMDKSACATLRANRPYWNIVQGDIASESVQKAISDIKVEVDLLTGGFPCQAFSYAGKSLGFEDTRGTLFFEMAKAIKTLSPKVFMAENVRALLTHDGGRTIETIKNIINEIGYELIVKPKVVKAIFYKVPQKRERLILIAVRKDLLKGAKFKWPSAYNKILTVRDALTKGELFDSDCPTSNGPNYSERKKEIMQLVPQGGYWKHLPDEIQREYMKASYFLGGGKTGMARRLSMDEPSLTLTCAPAQNQTERCHPLETRPLQEREYARIQTFPDSWEFKGSSSAIYKQIGNAVPVNMAAALGRSIVRMLNEFE